MESPIQLKFFKKIELYQEYKSLEDNPSDDTTKSEAWNIEKRILKWTTKNHWHRGVLLTDDGIKQDILKENPPRFNEAIGNLIEREYAKREQGQEGIKINKEGFLMGEVINDVDNNSKWKYQYFFYLIWITVYSGAIIVTINALKIVFFSIKFIFLLR